MKTKNFCQFISPASKILCQAVLVTVLLVNAGWAGSIFLTGHDPDFHALSGFPENPIGAQNINTTAINFVTDPTFNSFTNGGINKFLFVESKILPPFGHRNGVNGMIASGFTSGVDFEHHDASTLDAELDLLGTKYNAIVVASDFGGVFTQAELDILNSRSNDIIDFLNVGGGLYAMAEGNSGSGLTPDGGHYGYLPFVVTSTSFNQSETGLTVTPFGASLGLSDSDVNGNFSHNIFLDTSGTLDAVDLDADGNILSVAGRTDFIPPNGNPVPEPATLTMVIFGVLSLLIGYRIKSRGSLGQISS